MFDAKLLAGQTAVVTGGATGIGLAIAQSLAAHGADVALASRKLDRLEEAAEGLRKTGRKAKAFAVDISDSEQVRELFRRVDEEFGRVDLLVNNAAANFMRPTEMLTSVRWRKVIDIVLNGTFHCSLEAGKRMLKQGSGNIVNLVASYAWMGAPGLAPSASAKAGVVALTKTLGAEWADRGVRVNAVCPGLIDTPQSRELLWPEPWIKETLLETVPMGRFGTEQDAANLVLYLASPMAQYITGAVFVADGGQALGQGALKIIKKAGAVRRPRQPAQSSRRGL
jgi:NAD(P)-dependent dehydrogenase (short-subunit alcohol dehydrogenase family)